MFGGGCGRDFGLTFFDHGFELLRVDTLHQVGKLPQLDGEVMVLGFVPVRQRRAQQRAALLVIYRTAFSFQFSHRVICINADDQNIAVLRRVC